MRDASLPPDWRIKAAQSALPYVHVKPERSPATDLEATATQIEGESDSDPLSEAIRAFRRGDYDGAGSRGPRAAQKRRCCCCNTRALVLVTTCRHHSVSMSRIVFADE